MGSEIKPAVIPGFRDEEGWFIPDGQKFGTYYRRHAEALKFVLPYLPLKRTVVQAGGHMGAYPIWLSKVFNQVFTYEADLARFQSLVINAAAQGVKNIVPFWGVVGSFGSVRPSYAIDDLDIRDLDLLALDIDGGELEALLGAYDTIKRCWPIVLMEECRKDCRPEGDRWLQDYNIATELLRSIGYVCQEDRCGPDLIWKPK